MPYCRLTKEFLIIDWDKQLVYSKSKKCISNNNTNYVNKTKTTLLEETHMQEENILNIQIKVTDEQMNQLIKGKLEALPDDKIQEILGNALEEFLKTDNGKRLFYTKEYYQKDPQPTELLTDIVKNSVSKDLLNSYANELMCVLKDNYCELLQNAMIKVFSDMFFTQIRESTFRKEIMEKINNICNSKLNNNVR